MNPGVLVGDAGAAAVAHGSDSLLGQLELVADFVAVAESATDGVADAETLTLGHDLVVGGAQRGHLAAVNVSEKR